MVTNSNKRSVPAYSFSVACVQELFKRREAIVLYSMITLTTTLLLSMAKVINALLLCCEKTVVLFSFYIHIVAISGFI